MYTATLVAHNLVRWVVLLAGIWAVARVWRGWLARGLWTSSDLRAGRWFVNAVSLQLILGVALYVASPLVQQGLADMATAMRTPSIRYFVVEHGFVMLVAVALAHIGLARVNRATTDLARFRTGSIWWGIAVAAMIGFTPWDRPRFPF